MFDYSCTATDLFIELSLTSELLPTIKLQTTSLLCSSLSLPKHIRIPSQLIIIAAWIGMTIIGLIVVGAIKSSTLQKGNPYRLLNPVDYTGTICGYGGNVTSSPFGYYLLDKTAVCVSSCPSAADYSSFICRYDLQAAVDADSTTLKGLYYVTQGECMYKIKTRVGKTPYRT
jgi:hypothetical protein